MGRAGAESPAPWSEYRDGWVPDTFSVLMEKNSGCSGASRNDGFRVRSLKTSPFPRGIPDESREQITKRLLTILSSLQTRAKPTPILLALQLAVSVPVCVCMSDECMSVCVCVCVCVCMRACLCWEVRTMLELQAVLHQEDVDIGI